MEKVRLWSTYPLNHQIRFSMFFSGARQVFERWMEWEPDEQAWLTYIKFELRYKEIDRARRIYDRFVMVHPEVSNWLKYSK